MRVIECLVSCVQLLLHAYWLIEKHANLVFGTPDSKLSTVVRHHYGVNIQAFIRCSGKVDDVLQGRFKAIQAEANAKCYFDEALCQAAVEYCDQSPLITLSGLRTDILDSYLHLRNQV